VFFRFFNRVGDRNAETRAPQQWYVDYVIADVADFFIR